MRKHLRTESKKIIKRKVGNGQVGAENGKEKIDKIQKYLRQRFKRPKGRESTQIDNKTVSI
jgi:hypothetical protein